MNNASRQRPACLVERITRAEITSGVPFNIGTPMPNGTIVKSIEVLPITQFNSATSDVLDIGHAGISGGAASGNAYKNDLDIKTAAAGSVNASTTVPGLINSTSGKVQLTGTWTGVGAGTDGEFAVIVTFVEDGREDFTVG